MSLLPVRVRYAPSPTGFLHLGGLRTALFNFALARRARAREAAAGAPLRSAFVLRIEDTDRARNVPGATAALQDALAWCAPKPQNPKRQYVK